MQEHEACTEPSHTSNIYTNGASINFCKNVSSRFLTLFLRKIPQIEKNFFRGSLFNREGVKRNIHASNSIY